jgi:hypothetical protein
MPVFVTIDPSSSLTVNKPHVREGNASQVTQGDSQGVVTIANLLSGFDGVLRNHLVRAAHVADGDSQSLGAIANLLSIFSETLRNRWVLLQVAFSIYQPELASLEEIPISTPLMRIIRSAHLDTAGAWTLDSGQNKEARHEKRDKIRDKMEQAAENLGLWEYLPTDEELLFVLAHEFRKVFSRFLRVDVPDPTCTQGSKNAAFDIKFTADGPIPYTQVVLDQRGIQKVRNAEVLRREREEVEYVAKVEEGLFDVGEVDVRVEGCLKRNIGQAGPDDWIKERRTLRVLPAN